MPMNSRSDWAVCGRGKLATASTLGQAKLTLDRVHDRPMLVEPFEKGSEVGQVVCC